MDPRRRSRHRPFERLRIPWHRARHGLSVRATARTFVVSVQTVVNRRRDVDRGASRLVRGRRAWNSLPDLVEGLVHLMTPDEIHAGRRRSPRPGPARAALRVRYLGDDRALPILRLRAAQIPSSTGQCEARRAFGASAACDRVRRDGRDPPLVTAHTGVHPVVGRYTRH